jgi:hypothetical protein
MISPMNIDKKYTAPLEFLGLASTEQTAITRSNPGE